MAKVVNTVLTVSVLIARLGAASPASADPVVLELFTSQGCSSCPPADAVLSRLGLDEATRATVVPLAFHVDYWDPIGWSDPFGKAEWSERQQAYARAFRLDGVYTPQLVVNGRAQLNGSQEQAARAEIAADLGHPAPARIALTERGGDGRLDVEVAAELTEAVAAGKLVVLVALFENGLVTPVARGENGGRTLRNDFIVRRLEKAFTLEPKAGARGQRHVALALHPSWKREHLGVAAFLQDPSSLRIYGAAVQGPPATVSER